MIKERNKKNRRGWGISVPLAVFSVVGVLLLISSIIAAPKTLKEWRYSYRLLEERKEDFSNRENLVSKLRQETSGDSYLHERHRRLVLIKKDENESVIYLRGLNKDYDEDAIFKPNNEFFDLLYK